MNYEEYKQQYRDDDMAKTYVNAMWELSVFKEGDLCEKLKIISDSDIDDDWSEFFHGDNLFKAGIQLLSFDQTILPAVCDKNSVNDKISLIADLCKGGSGLMRVSNDVEDNDIKSFILAETILLLINTKEFLRDWSRTFTNFAINHPAPLTAACEVLGASMRGEPLIIHSNGVTHRPFDEAGKLLEEIANETKEHSPWAVRRSRIESALESTY